MNVKIVMIGLVIGCWIMAAQADIYVNNILGDDANSGMSPDHAVKTISAGLGKLYGAKESRLVLAKTISPYYGKLRIVRGGTMEQPLIIEGGGAVISGLKRLPADQWEQKAKGLYFFPHRRYGALRPYLVINGDRVPVGPAKFTKLKPYSHYWAKDGVYFKPAIGKRFEEYDIFGTLLVSGVEIIDSSYVVCRNLISEYFSNDGFNIHGNCQFVLFENIVGRYNGDDGFSVHEDVGAIIRNGYFHHNDYGVQDVHTSRSAYYGLLVESNRKLGVHFNGGMHSVVNATVRNNAKGQVKINNGPPPLGLPPDNLMVAGGAFLKDLTVSGPGFGVYSSGTARTVLMNSLISHTSVGIKCDATAGLTVAGAIIQDCSTAMIDAGTDTLEINYSIVQPGKNIFKGKVFLASHFKDWREKCRVGGDMIMQKTDKRYRAHTFREGKRTFHAGLQMPQVGR